ncbi:MAG: hypothetical protein IKZ52_10570 [Bacteroidales bacterium]|nr:hypothetical protein [Bacteroidales bacterium]
MKRLLFSLLIILSALYANAQGFNNDKTELSMFVERMYRNAPFEGVKVMQDYDNEYILSVVVLPVANYSSESDMNRVAMVKAQRQVSTFFNGSTITSDLVITTSENPIDSTVTTSLTEIIRERSIGYVRQLELLTTFAEEQGAMNVFVYYKKL